LPQDEGRGEFKYDACLVGERIKVVGGLVEKDRNISRLPEGCSHAEWRIIPTQGESR